MAEADGGILHAASRALSLRFLTPEGTVRLRRIWEVELVDADGSFVENSTPMFSLADRAIVAVDAAKVMGILRARSAGLVELRVLASDQQITHASLVEFRIE